MGYRDLGDIDEKIIRTILKMGAENGVSNVSSKRVAAICGISSGTIFHKYGTMKALLDAAAQAFDRPSMALTAQMAEQNLAAAEIWDKMLDHFLSDPDGTLYYISYTNTFGFDPTTTNPRAEEFLGIARIFFRSCKSLTDNEYLVLWDYITSMAFYYAEKYIHGYLPYTEKTRTFTKQIVFQGINGAIQ
jgi:AcrR family transcriptional regulator